MIHERSTGLVVAGTVMFLPAYLLQVLAAAGISLSATDSSCSSCSKQAKLFLIPVLGPSLGSRADPQPGSIVPYLVWGGLEAAGATMLIVGLVGHDVPLEPIAQGRNLTLLPFVTPQAEGLSLLMDW
jgi:hypothetical protein